MNKVNALFNERGYENAKLHVFFEPGSEAWRGLLRAQSIEVHACAARNMLCKLNYIVKHSQS